jgi:signal transduction histidine kinase
MSVERTAPGDPESPGPPRPVPWWRRGEERGWSLLWDGFAALTLAVPTGVAVAQAPEPADAAVTLGLAGGLAVWHWLTALRRTEWDERAPMLLWLAGVLALTWALLGRHEAYLFLIYGLYPQLFARLGRWTVPGVAALTILVAWRTGALVADDAAARWGLLGSLGLALLIGFFVNALARQTSAREEALAALEATQAELAATSRRAGALAERERLAADLHDTIAQGFTGIVMQLEAAEQALGADADAAAEHLDRAKRAARDSLGELRRAVHAVRPHVLDDNDLAEALQRTARRWSQETGIPATTSTEGAHRPLAPDAEVALLRTAQEGLANVAKHARARTTDLRLSYLPGRVVLTVTDDGAGFDPAASAGGAGLDGLTSRLAALGGRLDVDSTPGGGTTLVAEIQAP